MTTRSYKHKILKTQDLTNTRSYKHKIVQTQDHILVPVTGGTNQGYNTALGAGRQNGMLFSLDVDSWYKMSGQAIF